MRKKTTSPGDPLLANGDEESVDRDFITSAARALSVLECFRRGDKALGNKEISQRTGLHRSTIVRLTYTLTKLGYLEFHPAQQKYSLTVKVLTLGQAYLAGHDVRDVARPLMQAMASDLQASVALGVHDGYEMVFLELCHGHQFFRLQMGVGERVPHATTALGRAYSAALSEHERNKVMAAYARTVKKETWAAIKEGLEQGYKDYQKYGFVFSLGDWNKDVFAVGVPIVSDDGNKILAFSCFGPVREMTRKRLITEVGPRLIQLRDRVKTMVGGTF